MTAESSRFKPVRVTLSGSFHKDPGKLEREYQELVRNQCQVLSPRTLDFNDPAVLFVRNRVEERDSVEIIQSHHFQAIALSDFVWLHAPDGYVGLSGAMEIGYAVALNIPVFSSRAPKDETLKHFVQIVPSVFRAIEQL